VYGPAASSAPSHPDGVTRFGVGVQKRPAPADQPRVELSGNRESRARLLVALFALALACCAASSAATPKQPKYWASSEIAVVTGLGVLGNSVSAFDPQAPLTQGELTAALTSLGKAQDRATVPPVLTPTPSPVTPSPVTPAPAPSVAPPALTGPAEVMSSIPDGATIGATANWAVTMPNARIRKVTFAVDGVRQGVESHAPFSVTTNEPQGAHELTAAVHLTDGETFVAAWKVTVAASPGPLPSELQPVPITHVTTPAPDVLELATRQVATASPPASGFPSAAPADPSAPVTIKQLDAALVGYLDLDTAATEIQNTLAAAGLNPPANTGTEAVARLLGLRYDHPESQDNLELLPDETATRAEAAYSLARIVKLDPDAGQWAASVAAGFTLPALTSWQQTVLTTAVQYVGYPYVWGGSSPTTEAPFGVEAPGGFDCSGFVWRVFKLTPYAGERNLADVIKGRTTYVMSGEVPKSKRIPASKLQPGDVMFFGVGPKSTPDQVGHTGIYLGNGWLIQSSGQGVSLAPFEGWYARTFAWARRPLQEAGLS